MTKINAKREGEMNSWQWENEKRKKKGCEEKGSNFGKGKEKDFSKMRVGIW